MGGSISLIAAAVSFVLTAQVGRQYLNRRRPYQLIWTTALALFTIGVACQAIAEVYGWSVPLYRVWYLSGAILAAAFLGQGTVYLMLKRRTAHIIMGLLGLASIGAAIAVVRAPVDLPAALSGTSISGHGMPWWVRVLTPFFNIYGTSALVVGAWSSVRKFVWNGGGAVRALGTGLIGIGAIVVATGGTLMRYGLPGDLYSSELIGIITIFTGFTLTARPISPPPPLTEQQLKRRRRRVTKFYAGTGLAVMVLAIVSLPLLPYPMGILTSAKTSYTATVPADNKGAYLVTDQGAMQLYDWYVPPKTFPTDAPTLLVKNVHEIVVVQNQFDSIDGFQLINQSTQTQVRWKSYQITGKQLTLVPQSLGPGDYLFIRSTDSMYGGDTYHYFHLR